jgi:hypothetical protein
LAKVGQTEVQSSVFHFSALVPAGQATLNFLFLTSTKYFQSAAVVGRRNSISQPSPILDRYARIKAGVCSMNS